MALSFANAVGNIFNRIGKLGAVIANARSNQNTQLTALTNTTTGVVAQYNAESDIQALIGSSYIGVLNSIGSVGSLMQSVAATTLNRAVFRDNPRLAQTLTGQNTTASLQELIRQMRNAGASVLAATIGTTASTFSGTGNQTGNAVVVASVRRPLDGLVLENAYAETVLLTCTDDSYSGTSTAGNETISATGTGKQTNPFAFDWPLGSDCSTSLSVIDGNVDNGSGNLLVNSGFESWTGNTLNSWTTVTGASNIADENSIVYDPVSGGSSLRITGDSPGTLTTIKQQFNSGSVGSLDELTQYSVNVFVRRDGTAAAAGVLTVDLIDGSDVVIQDENGANNSFTIDLTALTTSFASYNVVFRTPAALPSAQYIRLRLTTALTNGRSVYFDKLSCGTMSQLYTSGPYVAVHAGSIPMVTGDFATLAVTNSRGAAGTLNTFQTLCFRLYPDIETNEFLLPSSAVPTISDTALIA